jgi:hypothetical protein
MMDEILEEHNKKGSRSGDNKSKILLERNSSIKLVGKIKINLTCIKL